MIPTVGRRLVHLVERFRAWSLTVPRVLSAIRGRSGRGRRARLLRPHSAFEYACHEGNYAMRNILSGARAAEKATAGK